MEIIVPVRKIKSTSSFRPSGLYVIKKVTFKILVINRIVNKNLISCGIYDFFFFFFGWGGELKKKGKDRKRI